jgi:hypothetical protein
MANSLGGTAWALDTAGVITTDRVRCNLRWVGSTTAGHLCTIANNAGRVVWSSAAAGANNVESDLLNANPRAPYQFDGFNLTAIGSGILYVEIL